MNSEKMCHSLESINSIYHFLDTNDPKFIEEKELLEHQRALNFHLSRLNGSFSLDNLKDYRHFLLKEFENKEYYKYQFQCQMYRDSLFIKKSNSSYNGSVKNMRSIALRLEAIDNFERGIDAFNRVSTYKFSDSAVRNQQTLNGIINSLSQQYSLSDILELRRQLIFMPYKLKVHTNNKVEQLAMEI